MKNKIKPLAVVMVFFALMACAVRADSEWIDTNGDGNTDTLLLDPFVVNGNDPDTFDMDGMTAYYDQMEED